jgi:hypothetical protein
MLLAVLACQSYRIRVGECAVRYLDRDDGQRLSFRFGNWPIFVLPPRVQQSPKK